MRNIFALLVAINNYDQAEIKDLAGCLNDLEGIEQSLESYCRTCNDSKLHKLVLKQKEATRQAVIDGFRLFDHANDQDVCLFYFSGHGAHIDAPAEFWNEPDQKLEAIVCHVENGNDNLLIDKELSFLIAKAQEGKEVHFVVITDSCHSGSNTKDNAFTVRSVPPNINTREIDAYLGRSDYAEIKDESGTVVRLSPPVGKHFKLGACTSSELAKEKPLGNDGRTRGVFTYAMLQVLKDNGYGISYSTLITKARIKAQALTKDQSPQIETIRLHPQECSCTFLNGLLKDVRPVFQVSYGSDQWEINVGHIYGIQKHDAAILEDGRDVEIREVFVGHSVLDFGSLAFYDRERIYDATIRSQARKKLNLVFAPGSSEDAKAVFLALLDETKPNTIEVGADRAIDYVIHAVDNVLALTHPEGKTPVFSRISGQGKAEARLFLKILEQIAEWHHIISIANADSTIGEDEIAIELRIVENPHRQQNPDTASATRIEDWRGENVFRYHFDDTAAGEPWHPPAFRLSIVNRSNREFWVSALYCGTGYIFDRTHYTSTSFSITNQFLEKEHLERKGQVAKMTDELNDPNTNRYIEYESIQLSVLDDYFDQGYNEIKDIIKIFVSTDEIDTMSYNMVGIPIDTQGILAERPGDEGPVRPSQPDWRTVEIPITILRPRDEGVLNVRQDKSLYGLTIVGHPAFSARIVLSTVEEFIRSTKLTTDGERASSGRTSEGSGHCIHMPRPEIVYGNDNVSTIELTNGLGDIEGAAVIEFYRTKGVEFINNKQPLLFRVDDKRLGVDETRKLMLVGYSAAKREFFALGTMNDNREIEVDLLPDPSPSLIHGLGKSIKLLLLSVKSGFEIVSYRSSVLDTGSANTL
jgi:hypothetical protein